ncbi:MAG: histidine kinase [Bacteroidota bacterium]
MAFILIAHTAAMTQSNPFLDSLKQVYIEDTGVDKAKSAFEVASQYFNYQLSIDSVQQYTEIGLELSEEFGYERGFVDGNYRYALVHLMKGEYDKSTQFAQASIDALPEDRIPEDERVIVMSYQVIGNNYMQKEDFESALVFFQKGARQAEENEMTKMLPMVYTNIGVIYDQQKDRANALENYQKAWSYIDTTKITPNHVTLIGNIVACYNDLRQSDSARYYAEIGLKYAREVNLKPAVLNMTSLLATTALNEKQYEQVISLTNEALAMPTSTLGRDYRVWINLLRKRTEAFYHTDQIDEAVVASNEALSLLDSCSSSNCQAYAYKAAHFIQGKIGNYEAAYGYLEKYKEANDSLFSQETTENMQRLETLYETEKKERALAQLEQETSLQSLRLKQRNLWIIGILIGASLLLFTIYLWSQKRVLQRERDMQATEQKLLRLQMNPHFLFNALSSIQSFLFDKSNVHTAIHYLANFAQLMRQILEYSREQYISLDDEIRTLENYLSLQQLRYDHAFAYDIRVADDLNRWETLIPPLMAQPFVENAIEHGRLHMIKDGNIQLLFTRKDNQLQLIIEDNGIGRTRALELKAPKQHQSLATKITKDRIALLNRLTKTNYSFEVNDLPQRGTQVVFHLPLQIAN